MSVQTQLQNARRRACASGGRRTGPPAGFDYTGRGRHSGPDRQSGYGGGYRTGCRSEHALIFCAHCRQATTLPITTANLTDDPTLAAYLQVTVKPVTMLTIFPLSLLSGRRIISVSAQSVAGYDQVLCNATPLYVCNPFEAPGMSYYQATQALVAASQDPGSQHRLIRLAGSQFNNGAYGAGTVGYIAPDTGLLPAASCGPGAGYGVPQALAASQVHACFRLSAVNIAAKRGSTGHGRAEHAVRYLRQWL